MGPETITQKVLGNIAPSLVLWATRCPGLYTLILNAKGKEKGKGKSVTVHAMKPYRASEGMAPLILNLRTSFIFMDRVGKWC